MKSLKSLIFENEEPFEEPTTGWAAPETSLEKLQELIPKSNLTEREKAVIQYRLNGMTLQEIGDKHNIGRNSVYLMLKRAIYKIKKTISREKELGN
jgi:DNA-directed RNA polymerase specialized sigma subunit